MPPASRTAMATAAARRVALRLTDRRIERRLVARPAAGSGRSLHGRPAGDGAGPHLRLARVDPRQLRSGSNCRRWTKALDATRYLSAACCSSIRRARAQRNVAHHYDIDGAIYDLFLDRDRQYSCAYFEAGRRRSRGGAARQEAAHRRQARHRAGPARARHRLGLGRARAVSRQDGRLRRDRRDAAATSSSKISQRARRQGRPRRAGALRVQGLPQGRPAGSTASSRSACSSTSASTTTPPTSARCGELLADDGVALIHTIGRAEPPTATNAFIAKYIFPGGYIPALSEMAAGHRAARGSSITDVEILRLHYAETLRAWRERFLANWDKAAAILRRALLPDVGVLPGRLRDRPSATRTWSCSRSSSPSASVPCRSPATTCTPTSIACVEHERVARP